MNTTPLAFGLQTSRDMLMKLKREVARLRSSTERQDAIDHGLNVAMTAWHLAEWVWPELKHSPGSLGDLRAFKLDVLNACPELRYCQIIATSAKHLGYRLHPKDQRFETGAAPAEVEWVNNKGQTVTWVNNKGEPIMWTSNAWDLWITEGDTRRRAAEVFECALDWWTQFIDANA